MQQDLCDILVTAYCAANGQITNAQISANSEKGRGTGTTANYISYLRLLKKYHFLKAISADTCILTAQGLVYVEENGLVPEDVIQRDQRLRAELMRVAEPRLEGDEGFSTAGNVVMREGGYTQEEIDGRYQYLRALHFL